MKTFLTYGRVALCFYYLHLWVFGALNIPGMNVIRLQFNTGAKMGVHRPGGVIGNQNDRRGSRRPVDLRRGAEDNAGLMDITDETVPELVIMDASGKHSLAAKRDNPDSGIGRRPAGNLAWIINGCIQRRRLCGIDKVHHPLANTVPGKEIIVTGGKDVDNGIADGENVNSR